MAAASSLLSRLRGRIDRALANRAVILCYHRVADLACNPFETAVTPAQFEEHLRAIRSVATPVPLDRLVASLRDGRMPHRAVALTFDDGYADLAEAALPLLQKYDTPATMFLVSGALGQSGEFWWDVLERVFLQPGPLPERLELELAGSRFTRELGEASEPRPDSWEAERRWLFDSPPPHTPRQQLVRDLHPLIGKLMPAEREHATEQLCQWAGLPASARPTHRTLTAPQAKQLADCPLIEIGGHTANHPMLPMLSAAEQQREISDDKAALEALIGRPIRHFAYPFGWHAEDSIHAAKQAGYASAATLIPVPLKSRWDPYRLPRLWAKPVGGEALSRQLSQWFARW